MDQDARPDPPASQQSAFASKSITVVQAAGNATVVTVQLSVIAAVVVVAVAALVVSLVTKSPPRSGPVPLAALTPVGARVLTDDLDKVDMVDGTKIKIARLSCANGTPALLTETYDLDGAYSAFTGRVSVDDDPTGKPVVFSLVADGAEIATRTVEVKQTQHIQADLTGVRKLTLRTTTTTCANVDAAWVESTLLAPGG